MSGDGQAVDEKEFGELINKYRAELYRYCLALSNGDSVMADETFSDVLKVVYDKWDSLKKGERFRIYLYSTAKMCNKALRRKKKLHHKRYLSLDSALAEGVLTEDEYYDKYFTDDTPVEVYIKKIESVLSEEDRVLFSLRYIEKRTLLEISELTAVPYSTLRYRYFKLEKQVREEIRKIFE